MRPWQLVFIRWWWWWWWLWRLCPCLSCHVVVVIRVVLVRRIDDWKWQSNQHWRWDSCNNENAAKHKKWQWKATSWEQGATEAWTQNRANAPGSFQRGIGCSYWAWEKLSRQTVNAVYVPLNCEKKRREETRRLKLKVDKWRKICNLHAGTGSFDESNDKTNSNVRCPSWCHVHEAKQNGGTGGEKGASTNHVLETGMFDQPARNHWAKEHDKCIEAKDEPNDGSRDASFRCFSWEKGCKQRRTSPVAG